MRMKPMIQIIISIIGIAGASLLLKKRVGNLKQALLAYKHKQNSCKDTDEK